MGNCVVVTAAESGYFDLLKDWLASIATFPELSDLEICVLDIGLETAQAEWLRAQGTRAIKPGWDIDIDQMADVPHYYKAMTTRPFLPRYFPGYDIIAWFDADIWVQTPFYLQQYLIGAERYGFVITPEIHRAYEILYGELNNPRLAHHSVYYMSFGRAIADQLIKFPIINSGAFAARTKHPIWAEWQRAFGHAVKKTQLKHSEQTALNFAIYQNPPLRPHLLPAVANWLCGAALPMWDPARRKLVEPCLPHDELGLVHLSGRLERLPLRTTTGNESQRA
jgi:hypothetical protein